MIAEWRRLATFDVPEAIKEVCREFMRWRHHRQYQKIDNALEAMEVGEFPTRVLLAAVIASSPCAADLRKRVDFCKRVRAKLVTDLGEEGANEQLRGLV